MKRVALAVARLIGLATPSQADYQAGQAAYRLGDYATALQEFKPLAERGDARAQASLGFMYDRGQGVPQNHAEAAKWFRKAAEQGEAIAQLSLGGMYFSGQGVPRDYVQAHMWIDLAASRFAPGSDRDVAIPRTERSRPCFRSAPSPCPQAP